MCNSILHKSEVSQLKRSILLKIYFIHQERRIEAISEAVRILKPGGQALITVWAKDQARGEKTSYLKQSRKNRKEKDINISDVNEVVTEEIKNADGVSLNLNLPVHTNRTQFLHQDVLVPWKLKNSNSENAEVKEDTFMRYYHVFEEGELENLSKLVPQSKVIDSFYEQGNWCIILEKTL